MRLRVYEGHRNHNTRRKVKIHFLAGFKRWKGYNILNGYSPITIEQVLLFSEFIFLLERFCFSGGTIVNIVAIQYFKVCLSVRIFVWAVNHVKVYPCHESWMCF